LRFSIIGSGSTQASVTRLQRLLRGLLKLGVQFFETRSVIKTSLTNEEKGGKEIEKKVYNIMTNIGCTILAILLIGYILLLIYKWR
jgi:hypothetical protein